jgi:hypothetical protein
MCIALLKLGADRLTPRRRLWTGPIDDESVLVSNKKRTTLHELTGYIGKNVTS